MTNSPNVLIISTKADIATDDVVRCLAAKEIQHYRLNTEDYPFQHTLTHRPGANDEPWLWCNGQPLSTPTSIWYRRLRTPITPEGMDEGIATFCRQETRAALVGSILRQDTRWMSHPANIWQAEYKPYQLDLAARHGLTIPRTLITNDPARIRQAFQEFGGMIVKPTRTGHVVNAGVEHAIYTSRVLEEHLDDLESARWSPAIYQELIPKRYDVRVTIVGNNCFAASIDSQSDPAALIDWRQTDNPQLPHYRHSLPGAIAEQLFQFMRSLRLTFGAVDLVQTPSGEYVFLEVTPSGRWLWLDDMLSFGISDSIAAWLAAIPCD